MKKEALFYKKLENNAVKCLLCPHNCILKENQTGFCMVRKNIQGTLYTLNYGEVVSAANDPIEKKPLYHFHPGKNILSIAANGCNLSCPYCQNWEISRTLTPSEYISPQDMVELAKRYGSFGIAYTYTEPLVWYEYVMDTAKLAKKEGLKNVLVTNGMIHKEPLLKLIPYIDAANIDLKSMRENFYKKLVKGDLETVKQTIKLMYANKVHVEITNLIIPEENDSIDDFKRITDFIASIDKKIPLHFSRYFPHYKFHKPPTPVEKIIEAYETAKQKLYYVYIGNVWEIENGTNTYCPQCNNLLIRRYGYMTKIEGIENKRCSKCGREVDILM